MRIAFVLNDFPLVSETFILGQIVGLLRRGHEVDVYADRPRGETAIHPEIARHRLIERTRYRAAFPTTRMGRVLTAAGLLARWGWRVPGRTGECLNVVRHGRRALNLGMLLDSLPQERIDGGYDVVHCHFGPNGQRAVVARRTAPSGRRSLPRFTVTTPTCCLGTTAATITTICSATATFSRSARPSCAGGYWHLAIPADRIVHLPMGVDVSAFPYTDRPALGGEPFTLLTVARLVEVKGVEYVLRAVALVKRKHPKVRYVVAGDGALRERLEALSAELGIAENVRFLGAVSRDRVPCLHRDAHAFVLASVVTQSGEEENQPVSVAEAQASGLPVVATSIGGVSESVLDGESGLLVPPRNAEALAAAIVWLIEHPEATGRMGRAGRRRVEEHFDAEKLHDQLVDVYRDAVRGTKGALSNRLWHGVRESDGTHCGSSR